MSINENNCEVVGSLKEGGAVTVGRFSIGPSKAVQVLKNYKALVDAAKYTIDKLKNPSSITDADCPHCGTAVENCIHIHMLEKAVYQMEVPGETSDQE